jgi:hypothetical protein
MRKYYSIPLVFFCIAAVLGIFLRLQFVWPTPGIQYKLFLHAHSHVMFLGWVFNALYLGFVDYHIPKEKHRKFLNLFFILQTLVIAMAISFPIQGYGVYSIIFSTLHTLISVFFVWIFLKGTQQLKTTSVWFARVSLLFFTLSAIGPFFLGYLMASGQGNSPWYNFAIYFYLHFQYNGFFIFGLMSLFIQFLEVNKISFNTKRVSLIGRIMAIACIPAYLLSILYSKPSLILNGLGAAAAFAQMLAAALFFIEARRIRVSIALHLKCPVYNLLKLVFAAFLLKTILQLFSAHPGLAQMAYQLTPVVIAYLHLVLIGVVTLFLLAWYVQMGLVRESLALKAIITLIAGFIGSQVCLILMPWWSAVFGESFVLPTDWIFLFSIPLVLATFIFLLSFFLNKRDKSQVVN